MRRMRNDILQETNIVLWQKAHEFDPTREFMPWAMRVAQLQTMAFRKTAKRQRMVFDDELLALVAEDAIRDHAEVDVRRIALADCLLKLSDDQQSLVSQRYQPGGSVNALAQRRNSTPNAVSEKLRRIRIALMLCIDRSLQQGAG